MSFGTNSVGGQVQLGEPQGPLDAELVICGRDFGFDEVAAGGRPFQGAAGKILNRALARANLERGRCLITNVVNARPLNNKWEAHSDVTIERGLDALRETLGQHPRTLIVALGGEAFQACRGRDPRTRPEAEFDGNGITELRGYVFDGPFGPVLASTHPAFILRTWLPWWPLLCWDLGKAKRWVDGVVGKGGQHEVIAEADGHEGAEALMTARALAVDIETAGDHAEVIKCVAFAGTAEQGVAFKFNESTRSEIGWLLQLPIPKIFHNGQFDVTVLERHGFTVNNWTDDTMLLWHVVEPLLAGKKKEKGDQTQKSLRFLASVLTNEPWWKAYDFQSEEDQLRLCARDARVTWACWDALRKRLDSGAKVT